MTIRFITDPASEINQILNEFDPSLPDRLVPFFNPKVRKQEHWSYRLVSSQMDADRLDYVQRDALFAGLRGHGFDIERVFDLLYHHKNSIAVDRGAVEAVEAYLVTMDQLYRAIYYHHAVRAATQMLMSLFKRAVKLYAQGSDGVFPKPPIKHPMTELLIGGDKVSLESYLRLTDYGIWSLIDSWQFHEDGILSDLSRRLLTRRLMKAIDIDTSEFAEAQATVNRAKELTSEIRGVGTDEYYVMIDEPTRTSYKGYDWRPESPDESIWLINGGRDARPLEDEDDNAVVKAFKGKRHFSRLIVLEEVRDQLRSH